MRNKETEKQNHLLIADLKDEVQALVAALKHLVIAYKEYDNPCGVALYCAENALKRHNDFSYIKGKE